MEEKNLPKDGFWYPITPEKLGSKGSLKWDAALNYKEGVDESLKSENLMALGNHQCGLSTLGDSCGGVVIKSGFADKDLERSSRTDDSRGKVGELGEISCMQLLLSDDACAVDEFSREGETSANLEAAESISIGKHAGGVIASEASNSPNSQHSFGSEGLDKQHAKKRKNTGIDLNKKLRQRLKVKKHRPRIFDASKPKKIPKPKKQRKNVRKSRNTSELDPTIPYPCTPDTLAPKLVICKEISCEKGKFDSNNGHGRRTDENSEHATNSCRRVLNFNLEDQVKEGSDANVVSEIGVNVDEHRDGNAAAIKPCTKNQDFELFSHTLDVEDKSIFSLLLDVLKSEPQDFGSSSGMRKIIQEYRGRNMHINNWDIKTLEGQLKDFPKAFKKMRTKRQKRTAHSDLWENIEVHNGHKVGTKRRQRTRLNRKRNSNPMSHVKITKTYRRQNLASNSNQAASTSFPNLPIAESSEMCPTLDFLDVLGAKYEDAKLRTMHQPFHQDNAVLNVENYGAGFDDVDNGYPLMNDMLDFTIQQLELLRIHDEYGQLVVRDENAAGQLIPFKGKIDNSKKRKPKVDLDQETMRVWNVLMENNGSKGTKQIDEEKEIWWTKERETFRKRVESFIARMHLIQGDRCFSQWKGSVVDSVVGVFLTQNVFDHLSSLAFMNLASHFPVTSKSNLPDGDKDISLRQDSVGSNVQTEGLTLGQESHKNCGSKNAFAGEKKENPVDWDELRKAYSSNRPRDNSTMDSIDWMEVKRSTVKELSETIKDRGMQNVLAPRIKDFLDRMVKDHNSIDLEWLRNVPPDKTKEYLLSIRGLGLKSVECVRLLTLHHHAFPVDTNVGRIVVRLGWVPLQPLPENLQLHLLNSYPLVDSIQKYLWPRLCMLDQRTLYELHYQMITFGKVFCTMKKPNCNECPLKGECNYFASAFSRAKFRLPAPQEKSMVRTNAPYIGDEDPSSHGKLPMVSLLDGSSSGCCDPIIELPASPEPQCRETPERDIEDLCCDSDDEIPTIRLNTEEFKQNLLNIIEKTNSLLPKYDISKALVAMTPEDISIPAPKLRAVSRLRTVHDVYELPDSHPLLTEFDEREPDDPCPYLFAIWVSDNDIEEQSDQNISGTILIPCRTATRGSFPLNGTYFQVNEVFADEKSSQCPISVARKWLWNLPRRSLYCGTSTTSIFKGLSVAEIQHCFWRGFVCLRGFDRETRAPRPLRMRFHPLGAAASKKREVNDE